MITLHLKKDWQVPTRWNELDADRFCRLCRVIGHFETGVTDFNQFRIETVAALLKVNLNKTAMTDTLAENFFRISEQLTFPYTIEEKEDRREVRFDIVLDRQLLPKLNRCRGYEFVCSASMVDTSLTAEQYVDALSLMQLYGARRDERVLDRLVSVLYAGEPYGKKTAAAVKARGIRHDKKLAVYYNFRGILEWIRRLPKYDIIFHHSGGGDGRNSPMGLEGSLYSMAKSGYGDYRHICRLNLFNYLDLLLAQTIESIRQLKGCGMKPTEIAEKLNLEVEQVTTAL